MKKKLELKKETVASLTTMNNLRGGIGATPTLANCPVDGPTLAVGCDAETMAIVCPNPNQTKFCSVVCVTQAGATCEGGANNCMQTGNC